MPIVNLETSHFPPELLTPNGDEILREKPARWWVLHTRPRQEKSLARDLLIRDIAFYLPMITKRLVIRGKVKRSNIPLFSSYLFTCCTPEERAAALSTKRVVSALQVDNEQQLRSDLFNIDQLIASGAQLTVESRLQANQPVRVKSGAFQGLEGIVCRRKNETRLIVWIKMLQQGVSLELDDCLLEPIG
jgi:transcriptional antiterminator RfaH